EGKVLDDDLAGALRRRSIRRRTIRATRGAARERQPGTDLAVYVEVARTTADVEPPRPVQVLRLDAVVVLRARGLEERARTRELVVEVVAVRILAGRRDEEDGARRERVPAAQAVGVPLQLVRLAGVEVLREEPLLDVAVLEIAVAVFRLDAGARRDLHLRKDVADLVLLEGVLAPSVGGELVVARAERHLLVDAGDRSLSRPEAVLPDDPAPQEVHLVAVEERVELVERERSRPAGADEEQVALGESRLDGRHVERLEELGLQQLADPGHLVARQCRVRVGEEAVSREARRVDV